MSFRTPVDISNRALQHVGADLIDEALGFAEDSKRARECSFCYPKLRQAELRRNVWRFAIKEVVLRALDATTMLLAPTLWDATKTYFAGSIVQDETNQLWISNTASNLNNQPENSLTWDQYFGPMSVSLYDSGTSYFAGELVYVPVGTGVNRVYLSLQNGNADNPATATAWDSAATYFKNQVVTRSAVAYMSLIDLNIGQDPALVPAAWVSSTSYSIGNTVLGSDNVIYTSLVNANFDNDPTTDGGTNWSAGPAAPWTSSFTGGTGSIKWLQVGGPEAPSGVSILPFKILYPIGTGPSSQSTTRNAFRLPAGFLRQAPSDPKSGSLSYLGASWGLLYRDWNFEGVFITSSQFDPIVLRFVADMVDVPRMDALFCEGLAARIGLEVCEPITQSTSKMGAIKTLYDQVMSDARTVNGIETGAEEPPVDDYIACRG